MALNETGTTVTREPKAPKKAIPVPADFKAAVKKNKKAHATFEAFSPSHRHEYLEWITEAKSAETRKRRLDQTIQWLAEGKSSELEVPTSLTNPDCPLSDADGLAADPHARDRTVVRIDRDERRLGRRIATPCRLTNDRARPASSAPCLTR